MVYKKPQYGPSTGHNPSLTGHVSCFLYWYKCLEEAWEIGRTVEASM